MDKKNIKQTLAISTITTATGVGAGVGALIAGPIGAAVGSAVGSVVGNVVVLVGKKIDDEFPPAPPDKNE